MLHSAPYFTAFGLLTVLHAVRVIQARVRAQVAFGDGGDPFLIQRMRIFGNFTEYVPIGLAILIGLEMVQAPVWYLHLTGLLLLLGRTQHAFALNRSTKGGRGRVAGMMLTFASLAIGSIGVSLFSFLSV